MESKTGQIVKKFVSFLLILSFITPFFYMPYQAKKAEAFMGFGDIVVDIKALVERITDTIAMTMAQQIIDRMVQSTVKWAQSGFEGNPAYVTDPEQFFTDIADGVVGGYIQDDMGYLCSPFQANIKLSLIQEYYEPKPFQCTLTDVVGNIEAFYDDFSQGGWDAWFSMTQNPVNNPYGAYLKAKLEMDARLAKAVGFKNEELNRNQGFLSWRECTKKNPPLTFTEVPNPNGGIPFLKPNPDHVPGKAVGECIEQGPVQTPGTAIKAQLDKVLGSGLEKLITAQHMDQLISAFATGLLTKYVFGPKGLFAKNNNPTGGSSGVSANNVDQRLGRLDLDGDNVPEGYDSDFDGVLESATDICYHGGTAPQCINSKGLSSSPYYTPICQAVESTILSLTDYANFLDKNADQVEGGASLRGQIIGAILSPTVVGVVVGGMFGSGSIDNFKNKADADLWANRTNSVNSSVDALLSNIQTYNSDFLDQTEIATNRFSVYLGKVLESLIKDRDLDLAKLGSGGGGLKNLMENTAYNLKYFREVKAKLGNCAKPNVAAAQSVELPPEIESGGQCVATGNIYGGALKAAMDAVIAENSTIADSMNTKENGKTFLGMVAEKLRSQGYQATNEVLNGNNNPNSGDLIAVWKTGQSMMERYDAIVDVGSGTRKIRDSLATNFVGFVPLNCTASGGGRECGCQTTSGGGEEGGTTPVTPPPGTIAPFVSSISPASVMAGGNITITGQNLTSTVQFFDGSGGRTTVTGSLNSSGTQVTVQVPPSLPVGNATVKVYKDASTVSNGTLIQITGTTSGGGAEATVASVEATNGWGGSIAHNPSNNTWLVLSTNPQGVWIRIMGNDMKPISTQLQLNTYHSGGGSVVFAPDLNKYLVTYISWDNGDQTKTSAIFGVFVNPDGTVSGEKFVIHNDNYPAQASLFNNRALRYDSKNKKFVITWEMKAPTLPDVYVKTISSTGVVGSLINLTGTLAKQEDDRRGSPTVAINEGAGEYCVLYARGHVNSSGSWSSYVNTRKINALTGALGPETTVISSNSTDNPIYIGGIAYNNVRNKYLVTWNGATGGTKGIFISNCDGSTGETILSLNPDSAANSVAYNSFSNTFAVIGQNGPNSGNTYVILDSFGKFLANGVAFAGGFGNFLPFIAPNNTDGTFGASSSYQYATTRFVSNLKR